MTAADEGLAAAAAGIVLETCSGMHLPLYSAAFASAAVRGILCGI